MDTFLCFGEVTLDPTTRDVQRGGRRLELTPTEYALLELFLSNQQRVLTHSYIFTHVWGFDFSEMSNALTVAIGNLRRKMEDDGETRYIHTVRGVGYLLCEPGT